MQYTKHSYRGKSIIRVLTPEDFNSFEDLEKLEDAGVFETGVYLTTAALEKYDELLLSPEELTKFTGKRG